jgi:RimJ/RimL family protein N-acetyltransferase
VILETERLTLRPMTAGDLDDLLAIFGDPGVMAAFESAPLDRDATGRWLERNLAHQRDHGYGLFAVCPKGSGRLIGDCGLEWLELAGEQVAELGYDLRRDRWNRGFATEAACAVRDWAFGTLGLPKLVSLVRVGNAASARVAEKAGMTKVAELEREGRPYSCYSISSSAASRSSSSSRGAGRVMKVTDMRSMRDPSTSSTSNCNPS